VNAVQEILDGESIRISPVYENPALLPERAESDWNKPYLNLVLQGVCRQEPLWLLKKIKEIEKILGREEGPTWAPRAIDIDILYWGNRRFETSDLQIPHKSLSERSFVLDPFKDLAPDLKLPHSDQTLHELARQHPGHCPLWMAILNITPDSFSDGGSFLSLSDIDKYLDEIESSVGIIDVGAESTRPNATPLSWRDEWLRLEPVLKHLRRRFGERKIKPQISVDTRHVEVAGRALELGVSIINDVSGAKSEGAYDLLKTSECQYVLTHSLTVPADPKYILSKSLHALNEIKDWMSEKLRSFENYGIKSERIILDPGIGFGKDSLQSLFVLRSIDKLFSLPCRFMVGHSRKSFIDGISSVTPSERDLESLGISLGLAKKGVDILRVHNPLAHIRAFRGFNHLWVEESER